jgi:hypothetical protein
LSSIPSLRSASSAKELPTLSISGSEKASICELAKKELRRKRETKGKVSHTSSCKHFLDTF